MRYEVIAAFNTPFRRFTPGLAGEPVFVTADDLAGDALSPADRCSRGDLRPADGAISPPPPVPASPAGFESLYGDR